MSVLGINVATARGSYYLTLVTVTLGFWLAYNLLRGNTGRVWTAIRDMDTAAAVIGIRVYRYKVLAFGVSSFFLGIAGALWAFAYLGTASVQSFDLDRSFQILFIIIIGGMGSLAGNFIGSIFILLLPLLLDRISQGVFSGHLGEGFLHNVEKIIFGSLIAFFVIKEPDGIANLIQSLRDRARAWPLRF
jgi:branched-chain amino acid transport system permease protein